MADRRVTIIGGGAAGCMAAVALAGKPADVTLIEKNNALGKKLLATGNGRCNFCHDRITPEDYHRPPDDPFIRAVLSRFGPQDCLRVFKELGITALNRNGYLYPYSEQARAVSEVLSRRVKDSGATILTGTGVTGIERKDGVWHVCCGDREVRSDAVILATGGAAAPVTGSDGKGLEICRSLGHHIIPPVPALTYLAIHGHPFKRAAGVRLMAKASVETDGRIVCADTGQVQITKSGFSGIPVFNVSRFAARTLAEEGRVNLHLRLVPDLTAMELHEELRQRFMRARITPYEALIGLLPDSFADCFLKVAGIPADKPVADREVLAGKLALLATDLCMPVSGTGDLSAAQVTCGGVDTDEVDPFRMCSKVAEDLYLAGEILDIDGMCGGFNLFFAWAGGWIAGTEAGV